MTSTSNATWTKRRMSTTNWWSWCFVILAVLTIIGCTQAQRYNRLFGPMLGKRAQEDSANFKAEEVFDFNVPEDLRKTDTDQYDLDQMSSSSCALDSLFMQLTPEWQQLIIKMMRQARYKS